MHHTNKSNTRQRYLAKTRKDTRSKTNILHNGTSVRYKKAAQAAIYEMFLAFFLDEIARAFLFNFVKIILLKSGNCALALRKRLFCAAKPTLLPCKRAAFGMQNNRFCNTLMMRWLHDSYTCEKYLHLYHLLFVQKVTLVRSRNVGRRHFTSF